MDTSSLNDTTPLTDDLALGHKVIGHALQLLTWGVTLAVAWSCSTVLMGIIMFIVMALVMHLLTALLHVLIMFRVPATSVESLGRNVGRFAKIFTRKQVAA